MSKVSSKRSRKSKLTRRDYEFEETKANFQKSSSSVPSAIPKPSRTYDDFEALIDSQKKPKEVKPQELKFSVTVAVEEFDEGSSDVIIVETNEQAPIEVVSSDSEVDEAIAGKDPKRKLSGDVIESPDKFQGEVLLNRFAILDAANEILENPENIADKILSIEVRNCIGQYRTSFVDKFEAKIQSVFHKWFEWQKSIETKFRSSPLFYKCYICRKSWWHFHDFREHLKGHDDFELDLKEYTEHEANIVAYSSGVNIVEVDFDTEGDCPKCGYSFDAHKLSVRQDSSYICKIDSCYRTFFTCFGLKTHEYVFHATSDLSDELLESEKRMFCKACSFIFYSQQSYQSHVNLMHTVRSDLVAPGRLKKCTMCNEKFLFGIYHVCIQKKLLVQCKLCYRTFQGHRQYRAHMAGQNGHCKCRICDEVLPKRCLEVEHLMKHTDKFVIVKKCLMCKEFTVFLDHQTAFDHVSVHLNMQYEGSNYKYISKILVPKSCLLQRLAPPLEIKEEPNDVIMTPELKIEQDDDDFETDADDETKGQIKEEIEIHDDFESAHLKQEVEQKLDSTSDVSRIFGIKIEANDMKQDMQVDDESEYEDDIIKLDFNFLNTMQESVECSTQDCIIKVEGNTEGTQEAKEEMQEDEDTQDDEENQYDEKDILEENENGKRNKLPKIYSCHRCGFAATHREYRAHMKSDCIGKVYKTKVYTCTKCSINFDQFNKFIDHFTEHNLNPLTCPECFKPFKSYNEIECHIERHIKITYVEFRTASGQKKINYNYKCKLCEKTIEKVNFFQHWVGHLTFVEKPEDVPEDTDVSDSSKISQEMLNELLVRLQSPLPLFNLRKGCWICVKHFVRKNDYKRHLVEHLLSHAYSQHYLYKHLKCQICEEGFDTAIDYKKHMREHGDLQDRKCEICDKFFSDSSNYTKHIKIHNKNAYTCDICKKKFQAKYSLEKHIVIHKNQNPIFCVPCKKHFFLESDYKKHFKVTHSKDTQLYACKICKKRFKRLKDRWDHLWYVHEERQQEVDCPKCSNSYRKFIDLKRHMRDEHLMYITNSKVYFKAEKKQK